MKIKSDYVLREVADQYIVVPTGSESVNFNGIITLNKSGSRLFKLLQSGSTKEQLITFLLDTYDVTTTQAEQDVARFIDKLESNQILE